MVFKMSFIAFQLLGIAANVVGYFIFVKQNTPTSNDAKPKLNGCSLMSKYGVHVIYDEFVVTLQLKGEDKDNILYLSNQVKVFATLTLTKKNEWIFEIASYNSTSYTLLEKESYLINISSRFISNRYLINIVVDNTNFFNLSYDFPQQNFNISAKTVSNIMDLQIGSKAQDVTNSWNYWRNCSTFCPYSCNDGKYVDKSPCSSNSSFGDLLIISDNVTLKHNLTSKMINVIYEEFVIAFDVYKTNVDQKDILRFCKDDNTCDDFIQVSYADYKLKVTFPNLTFGDYDMNSNSWSTIKILQQYINSSYFYSVVVNGAVAFFANNMLPKLFSNISVYNSDEYNPPEPIKNLYIISKTQVFWSQWGHWSKCNPSGFSNRTRYCKSNKWLNCLGNSTESKTCDTNPCYMKLDGVYLIQDVLMFLNCTSQQASYVNCSANQMFDPAYNKCMDSANYNLDNFCIGKFDSNYRNPWNCHSYISCNYYSSFKMDCPPKLVFYPMIDECVYENNFQCINIISTESNLFESALTSSLVALIFQSATLEPSFTLESSSTLELSSSLEPSSTLAPAMNLLTLNTVYEPLTPITPSPKIIEWSMWSDCSTTCGKGTRFRNSLNMASNPVVEECNTNSCPEDGNWGNWSISECSTTCGGGNIYFSRSCDNPRPSYNGLGCMGVNIYTEDCSINTVCPVNGNWSNWSSWSLCNQPCEGGIKSRFRVCSEPSPKYGGQLCDGNSTEIIDCSLNSCKKAKLSLSIFFVDKLYLITSELKDKINIAISNLYKDFKRTVTFNIVLHSIRDDDL